MLTNEEPLETIRTLAQILNTCGIERVKRITLSENESYHDRQKEIWHDCLIAFDKIFWVLKSLTDSYSKIDGELVSLLRDDEIEFMLNIIYECSNANTQGRTLRPSKKSIVDMAEEKFKC